MPGFNIPFTAEGCDQASQTGPQATLETARDHRWKITVCDPIKEILIHAKKCTRPAPEFDNIIYHHGINEVNMPGKYRFKPVEFTFYSVIKSSTDAAARYIYEWWHDKIYDFKNNKINTSFKNRIVLEQTDGDGKAIRKYTLHGCWIELVTPSDLDYTMSEISLVTVRIRYDYYEEYGGAGESGYSNDDFGSGTGGF